MAEPFDEEHGRRFLGEAEEKLASKSGFFGFLSDIFTFGAGKDEEARLLYVKAAHHFKLAKNWNEAGMAVTKAAELQLKKGYFKTTACSYYIDAANCFRKVNKFELAVSSFHKAAEIHEEEGEYFGAANRYKSIAELYETDLVNLEEALKYYEKASDYYEAVDVFINVAEAISTMCSIKVAEISADLKNYQRAIEVFEKVANFYFRNEYLTGKPNKYLCKAVLCLLMQSIGGAKEAMNRYKEMYQSFGISLEHQLLTDLIAAAEQKNADGFTAASTDKGFDNWALKMLTKVREKYLQ